MTIGKLTFKVRQVKEVDGDSLLYRVYTHIQEVKDTDNPTINFAKSNGDAAYYPSRNNIETGGNDASTYLKCLKYAFLHQSNISDSGYQVIWSGTTRPDFTYFRLVQPSDLKLVRPNYPDWRQSISWAESNGYVLNDDLSSPPFMYKAIPGAAFPISADPTAQELINCFSTYRVQTTTALTNSGFFVSDTLLSEFDDLKDAEDFSEEILDNIRDMKIIYEGLLEDNWSTMYDASSYTGGWNSYTLQ